MTSECFQGISVEVDGITPDMNQILGQIRQEYDEIAVKNRDEAEQWYKVSSLNYLLKTPLFFRKTNGRFSLNFMETQFTLTSSNDYLSQIRAEYLFAYF